MKRWLKGYDFWLLITPIVLAAFGVVMVYSASMVTAVVAGFESTHYLVRQGQWFILGMIAFFIGLIIPYRFYQKIVIFLVIGSVIALVAVLFFGEMQNNALRTISLAGFNIQPSEFVKLTLIIYLASVYAKKQAYIDNLGKGVVPPLVIALLMVALIIRQPDLGTAAIILFIIGAIVLSSGLRFKHLLLLGALALGMILLMVPKLISDERISRFTGAYDPFSSPDSDGYHLIQSYLAISGGGLTGEGLGQSIQKLGYLWGAHTDFIMAVIAEELGVFGVIAVIGLILLITLRGLFFARKCTDSYGSLLVIGIASMIGIQSIVNLGAISGVLPITGITLPFISYGGSSLLVTMASMGILNNVARHVNLRDEHQLKIEKPTKNERVQRSGTRWLI